MIVILSYFGPAMLLTPQRRTGAYYADLIGISTPKDIGLNYQPFNVKSFDGIELRGWLIRTESKRLGTIIFLHGVGDCKESALPIAKVSCINGYDTLLIDLRRHGESGGENCTYGYFEKFDIRCVIDALLKDDPYAKPIILFGTSMGAAIAMQTAAIDPRVDAVIAENCYTDLRTISVDYQKQIAKLPWHFVRNLVMHRAERIANFEHREASPMKALPNIHVPILLCHSQYDQKVKYEHALKLFHQANEPKKLYIIENANHADAWEKGGIKYQNEIFSFLAKHLS